MKPPRYWDAAITKRDSEARCRCCGSREFLEAAHIVGRSYDEEVELEDGSSILFVDPDGIVPLCRECHRDYDARALNLLPVLRPDEQAFAARHLGLERALHRTTGQMRVGTSMPG